MERRRETTDENRAYRARANGMTWGQRQTGWQKGRQSRGEVVGRHLVRKWGWGARERKGGKERGWPREGVGGIGKKKSEHKAVAEKQEFQGSPDWPLYFLLSSEPHLIGSRPALNHMAETDLSLSVYVCTYSCSCITDSSSQNSNTRG